MTALWPNSSQVGSQTLDLCPSLSGARVPTTFRREAFEMIRRTAASLVAVLSLLVVALIAAPSTVEAQDAPRADGLVVLESTQSLEETWAALLEALDANPNIRTIAQVDHGAAAISADLVLNNNRVVFFGNPALGTPVMQASRTAGIDLPQKMQVYEDNSGRVFVTYNAPSYIAARHSTGDVATLTTINGALSSIARAATNTEGAVAAPVQSGSTSAGAGLVTTTSGSDFETTWSQLITAINASPASVAFTVDHGANSGGTLPPTRLVVFGNPAIGTPMMASSPGAGVDLPLKMLVYEDDAGVTHVVSTAPSFVQSRHAVGQVATVANATGAIANFTAAATAGNNASVPAADDGAEGTDDAADAGDDEVLGTTQLAITGVEPVALASAVLMISVGGVFLVSSRRRD